MMPSIQIIMQFIKDYGIGSSSIFMGIIYMDFYYNRWDDMILSMSPLILLLFITQVDDVLKYLIVAMIVSNVTYWNCKNIYTFTLDSLFATTFIAYLFYKCIKLKQNLYVLVALLLVILHYGHEPVAFGRQFAAARAAPPALRQQRGRELRAVATL